MYDELKYKIGNGRHGGSSDYEAFHRQIGIPVGQSLLREATNLRNQIRLFTSGFNSFLPLPPNASPPSLSNFLAEIGSSFSAEPNYMGIIDPRFLITQETPAHVPRKPPKINLFDTPKADLSYSIFDDVLQGDKAAALKKIAYLKQENYPIFYELFYLIDPLRKRLNVVAGRQLDKDLTSYGALKDSRGNFDLIALHEILADKFSYVVGTQLWSSNLATSDMLEADHTVRMPLSIYGLAQTLIYQGQIDILKAALTPPVHPLDAFYLRYFLSDSLMFMGNKIAPGDREKAKIVDDYFEYIQSFLYNVSSGDTQWMDALPAKYKAFSELYFPVFECSDLELARDLAVKQDRKGIVMGAPGVYKFYPMHEQQEESSIMLYPEGSVPGIVESNEQRFAEIQQSMQSSLVLLEQHVARYLLQLPYKFLDLNKHRYGPWLRTSFPQLMRLLYQPLTSNEIALLEPIFKAEGIASPPLQLQVQPYQLAQVPALQELFLNRYIIPGTPFLVDLLPSGIMVVSQTPVSGKTLFQANRIYSIGPVVSENRYYANLKSNLDRPQWVETFNEWRLLFGQPTVKPGAYVSLELNADDRVRMVFQPHMIVLNQQGTHNKLYVPMAVGEHGFYFHIKNSATSPVSGKRSVFTGSCRFGGTLVGVAHTADGLQSYPLTDIKHHTPEGCITEVIETHPLHPEELLYLKNQEALTVLYDEFNTKENPLTLTYQGLFTNYLITLLPLLIRGKMTQEAFVQAAQLILNRDRRMCDAMKELADRKGYQFAVSSSLDLLGFQQILEEDPAGFVTRFMSAVGMPEPIDFTDAYVNPEAFEETLVTKFMDALCHRQDLPKEHREVWQYLHSHFDVIRKDRSLKGISSLSILDYLAQLAVTRLQHVHTISILQSREGALLDTYREHLAPQFGTHTEILWFDSLQVQSEEWHHMLYHVDRSVDEFMNIVETSFDPLGKLIASLALDDAVKYTTATKQFKPASQSKMGFFGQSVKPIAPPPEEIKANDKPFSMK